MSWNEVEGIGCMVRHDIVSGSQDSRHSGDELLFSTEQRTRAKASTLNLHRAAGLIGLYPIQNAGHMVSYAAETTDIVAVERRVALLYGQPALGENPSGP
jgi:hypothetical protein